MRLISEAEYEAIATSCHPSADPDHSETFWKLSAEIEAALTEIGQPHEGMGGGDFWMSQSYDENHRLSIELSTSKMMEPRLISIIQRVLALKKERWRIDITHDVLEMPFFFILVYRDECLFTQDSKAAISLFIK